MWHLHLEHLKVHRSHLNQFFARRFQHLNRKILTLILIMRHSKLKLVEMVPKWHKRLITFSTRITFSHRVTPIIPQLRTWVLPIRNDRPSHSDNCYRGFHIWKRHDRRHQIITRRQFFLLIIVDTSFSTMKEFKPVSVKTTALVRKGKAVIHTPLSVNSATTRINQPKKCAPGHD